MTTEAWSVVEDRIERDWSNKVSMQYLIIQEGMFSQQLWNWLCMIDFWLTKPEHHRHTNKLSQLKVISAAWNYHRNWDIHSFTVSGWSSGSQVRQLQAALESQSVEFFWSPGSPAHSSQLAQYGWNILERVVKPEAKNNNLLYSN